MTKTAGWLTARAIGRFQERVANWTAEQVIAFLNGTPPQGELFKDLFQ